jgi:hypothetical protein
MGLYFFESLVFFFYWIFWKQKGLIQNGIGLNIFIQKPKSFPFLSRKDDKNNKSDGMMAFDSYFKFKKVRLDQQVYFTKGQKFFASQNFIWSNG